MIRYISKEERDMAQSILIVDDERDIVSMLNQYFCKIGYVVYTAINGKEALNAITKHPDIILLDINMPDMNGFTICEKIRNFVSCPIIFLTARIEDCDKIKGFAVGGDDYVVKPFSVDELEARVAAHLRREKRHGSSAIVQFDNNIVIDYSSLEFTSFDVFGTEVRVYDEKLCEAIKKLSERRRNVVLMFYFLELPDAEIAEILDISRNSVYRNRMCSLKLIRDMYEGEL